MTIKLDIRYPSGIFESYHCYYIEGFKYREDADFIAEALTTKWKEEAEAVGSEEHQFCVVMIAKDSE